MLFFRSNVSVDTFARCFHSMLLLDYFTGYCDSTPSFDVLLRMFHSNASLAMFHWMLSLGVFTQCFDLVFSLN